MNEYVKVTFTAALLAFFFIYVIGALWAVPALILFSEHFENFKAVTLYGDLIERLTFLFSFLFAYLYLKKTGILNSVTSNNKSLSFRLYLFLEGFVIVGLSVSSAYFFCYGANLLSFEANNILYGFHTSVVFQIIVVGFISNLMICIGEEIVHRGIVFKHIFKHTGNLRASIFLSSLLFSIFHFQYASLISFVLAFGISCIFAYAYYRSGSLFVPIGMHFSYNLFLHIYLTPEKEYLESVLKTAITQHEGIGDAFAIFRLVFLVPVAWYVFKRYHPSKIPRNGYE